MYPSIRHAGMATLLGAILAAPVSANANRVFFDGVEALPESCNSPLVMPAGWVVRRSTWDVAWSYPDVSQKPTFPNSPGYPVPIGAELGELHTIAFVMADDLIIDITWDVAQNNPIRGYTARPADSMFIGISPCPGDVRPMNAKSEDVYLHPGCRRVNGIDSMFAVSSDGYSSQVVCPLEAGRLYFMTVAPVNPTDGLELGESTCSYLLPAGSGCDVQARHSGTPR